MTLPANVARCPGKWEPNEQTYLKEECVDCLRYLERNTVGVMMFTKPPVEDGFNCSFKIKEKGYGRNMVEPRLQQTTTRKASSPRTAQHTPTTTRPRN